MQSMFIAAGSRALRAAVALAALPAVAACVDEATAPLARSRASAARAVPTITMTDLMTDHRGFGQALGVNERGQIVGFTYTEGAGYHAVLWDGATSTELPFGVPATGAFAYAVYDAGQIVGFLSSYLPLRAVLWDDGTVLELGTLGLASDARAINDRGQVAGGSLLSLHNSRAFLWEAGVITDLGALPDGKESFAFGINARGQVVGYSTQASGVRRAVLWANGQIVDLGTLLGGESDASAANAINNRGQVVGYSGAAGGATHAFLWEAGAVTDLGTLGGSYSAALAIGPNGRVVGESTTAGGETHAFLWDRGVMTDLGASGASSSAAGISAAGRIVGFSGGTGRDQRRPVLWIVK